MARDWSSSMQWNGQLINSSKDVNLQAYLALWWSLIHDTWNSRSCDCQFRAHGSRIAMGKVVLHDGITVADWTCGFVQTWLGQWSKLPSQPRSTGGIGQARAKVKFYRSFNFRMYTQNSDIIKAEQRHRTARLSGPSCLPLPVASKHCILDQQLVMSTSTPPYLQVWCLPYLCLDTRRLILVPFASHLEGHHKIWRGSRGPLVVSHPNLPAWRRWPLQCWRKPPLRSWH